jgi:hypothetical protein
MTAGAAASSEQGAGLAADPCPARARGDARARWDKRRRFDQQHQRTESARPHSAAEATHAGPQYHDLSLELDRILTQSVAEVGRLAASEPASISATRRPIPTIR